MTLEELEKRIKVLEDTEEIKKLHRQYMWWLTNNQWDDIINCFTDDATAQAWKTGEHKGREGIIKICKQLGEKKTTKDAHFVGQAIIDMDGDKANGRWNVCLLFTNPIQWVQGVNECEYRKENGKWKFSRLKFTRLLASDPSLL